MTSLTKTSVLGIISFLVVIGFSIPATTYAQYNPYADGGNFFFPTGNQDFWGNQLCNWGSDYQGYPCDQDPHQWIQDPYTGTYY